MNKKKINYALAFSLMVGPTLVGCARGPRGITGPQGPQGEPGSSCVVVTLAPDDDGVAPNGGAMITCGTSAPVIITNGKDAEAPVQTFQVIGLVDPCGDAPGIYDEVFFKLADGRLVASFSDSASGLNTRLSVVPVGVTLVTTDGSGCQFSVNEDGELVE